MRTEKEISRDSWQWDRHAEVFMRSKFLPRTRGQSFLVEQFRVAAAKNGVPMPANRHTWGAFVRRMRIAGLIKPSGYALDSFSSPKTTWMAA